uniref:tRNA (cytosine(34)-C(5))-methyltransferase n=1 Tax=Ascaris suum TaxID=6253 RepID=F1KYX9_ASCSU
MQIIEMMHEDSDTPSGLVVANDVDNSRCYLLVRQALKRMPTSNCVVINEDAAFMPTFILNKDAPERVLFDRILCDVICSGDGTFRKNPEMWRSWSPQKAIGLHKLQANIARRCLQLLAVDGLMVYSTCSLNPIEDEAVIAEMLRFGNGSIELVDVSDRLPQLKRSPGVSSWKVFDKDMTEYKSPDEVPEATKKSLVPSMFPPTDEEKQTFHLERCFRILPHMQNTGGFFVAVLRKTRPISTETPTRFCSAPPTKRRKTFKEDPFVFLKEDDERWKEIAEYYGILKTFPYKNLLGRTNEVDKKRTLYFVSDAVKEFLTCNQDKVKVINAGLRMFGRVETKFKQCRFRMSQDGVRTILPFLTKRVVEVDAEDLLKILLSNEEHENYPREKLKCNEKLDAIDLGSVVLVTTRNGVKRAICTWMGAKTIAPYISKEERIHVCRMLGYDTSNMENVICSKRQSKAIRDRDLAAGRKAIEQANSEHETRVDEAEHSPIEVDDRVEGIDANNLQSNFNLDHNNCGKGNDLA